MGKKRVMLSAEKVDISTVKYDNPVIKAPHFMGFILKLAVYILEMPLIGPIIFYMLKRQNNVIQLFRNTVIPEAPLFKPEFPPQGPEPGVIVLEEDGKPQHRVEMALKCLSPYEPASPSSESNKVFRYWKIRDYAQAYRSKLATPSMVAENIISAIEELSHKKPPSPLLISFDAKDIRKQASASTQRFEEGNPLSILDGVFMAIKDDIDCYPHQSMGATTWLHEIHSAKEDAVCVSKLRKCGVILIGKANMHELGMGTTGNNSNYGTVRNPHAPERYAGGSSSGPAAIVASGLCSAALGTDAGGSIRIPSALCGIVGLKTAFGRIDTSGAIFRSGTVEVIGPIASSVEDVMLVYAAIQGSSAADKMSMKPCPPCLPNLQSPENSNILGSLRLGKYTDWFNDVHSTDISHKCFEILKLFTKTHGCEMVEIIIPELNEMRDAHLVTIGAQALSALNPSCEDGKNSRMTYDTRTNLALFRSYSASDYVTAQCLRRRLMYYHMEIFKKVDIIVTPTTGMTAPKISPGALKCGETDIFVTGYLMRFILAANLLGFPAISVPVGFDKQGLPIGLQLIGRPWQEASILRAASAIEKLCATSVKMPTSFYDILKIKKET